MTDKLAEVREEIIKIEKTYNTMPGESQHAQYWEKHRGYVADKILNTPIPIEGGVCPECEGKKQYLAKWGTQASWGRCPKCKGTGKLDKTITVREAIERVIG